MYIVEPSCQIVTKVLVAVCLDADDTDMVLYAIHKILGLLCFVFF